ncbi:hypothetical protein H9P43_001984 [Blastocladiella emersonii ATCC 22665]|nr:hypothetical protein H9P43_001984 [Blastocladiella emersonii ATCC 22665]
MTNIHASANKRTVRKANSLPFVRAIAAFRAAAPVPRAWAGKPLRDPSGGRIFVCARVRPRLDTDPDEEYDSVTCAGDGSVVVHNGALKLGYLVMTHSAFRFDRVFDQSATNGDVQAAVMERWPDMFPTSKHGPFVDTTVLMYGKTGTGKSHTSSGLCELVCTSLLPAHSAHRVTLTAVEVVTGTKGFIVSTHAILDLQQGGAVVKFTEDAHGVVQILGAVEAELTTPEGALAAVARVLAARRTVATKRNTTSSRSHLVLRFRLYSRDTDARDAPPLQTIQIVDLAGNENRHDQFNHTPEQTKEAATINTSLATLKDCISSLSEGKARKRPIPYRGSTITRILKQSFTEPDARLLFFGTLTGLPSDLDQTLQTLRYMGLLKWKPAEYTAETTVRVPT